jgi:Bacterial HORMA domain family 1
MTISTTRNATFTITEARYVGAKIGADLRLLNTLYGRPPLSDIDDYAEEAAVLLRDGYLNTVDYGFKDHATNTWKLRLRYTATSGGYLTDSRPGSLPTALAVAGYPFYSYLTRSTKYHLLPAAEQAKVDAAVPITRTGADEPGTGAGSTSSGIGYARNGVGVTRDVFHAF